MGLAGSILRAEQADAENDLEVLFDEQLERLLNGDRGTGERLCMAIAHTEKFNVAHRRELLLILASFLCTSCQAGHQASST